MKKKIFLSSSSTKFFKIFFFVSCKNLIIIFCQEASPKLQKKENIRRKWNTDRKQTKKSLINVFLLVISFLRIINFCAKSKVDRIFILIWNRIHRSDRIKFWKCFFISFKPDHPCWHCNVAKWKNSAFKLLYNDRIISEMSMFVLFS